MADDNITLHWVFVGLSLFGLITVKVQVKLLLSTLDGVGNYYVALSPFLRKLQGQVNKPLKVFLLALYVYFIILSIPWPVELSLVKGILQTILEIVLVGLAYWVLIRLTNVSYEVVDFLVYRQITDKMLAAYLKDVLHLALTIFLVVVGVIFAFEIFKLLLQSDSFSHVFRELLVTLNMLSILIALGLIIPLRNFFSSAMLLFDKPFELGDKIEISGIAGTVKKVGVVSVELLQADNTPLNLPSIKFYTENTVNYGKGTGRKTRIRFNISDAYSTQRPLDSTSLRKLKRSLQGVIAKLSLFDATILLEKREFSVSWNTKCGSLTEHFQLQTEVILAVTEHLEENGIEFR